MDDSQWIKQPCWITYLMTGVTALTMSAVLSGCRIGNKREVQDTFPRSTTGFYLSEPQWLKLKVTTPSGTQTMDTATHLIPSDISIVMSRPVYLFSSNKDASFISENTGNYGFYLNPVDEINSTFKISASEFGKEVLWTDQCIETRSRTGNGAYSYFQEGTQKVGDFTVQGRLSLHQAYSRTWEGSECAEVLEAFRDCFVNANSCWGNNSTENDQIYAQMHNIFDPFIDSGAMTVDDIKALRSIEIETFYE